MSTLLQDLLREKKAESRRLSRKLDADSQSSSAASHGIDPREVQSSPLAPVGGRSENPKSSRRVSGMPTRSISMPKEMGVREIEEVRNIHRSVV